MLEDTFSFENTKIHLLLLGISSIVKEKLFNFVEIKVITRIYLIYMKY